VRREDDGFFGTPNLTPASAPAVVSIMVDADESVTAAPIDQLTDVDNFLRNNYVQVDVARSGGETAQRRDGQHAQMQEEEHGQDALPVQRALSRHALRSTPPPPGAGKLEKSKSTPIDSLQHQVFQKAANSTLREVDLEFENLLTRATFSAEEPPLFASPLHLQHHETRMELQTAQEAITSSRIHHRERDSTSETIRSPPPAVQHARMDGEHPTRYPQPAKKETSQTASNPQSKSKATRVVGYTEYTKGYPFASPANMGYHQHSSNTNRSPIQQTEGSQRGNSKNHPESENLAITEGCMWMAQRAEEVENSKRSMQAPRPPKTPPPPSQDLWTFRRSILLPAPGVSSPRVRNQIALLTNVPKNQAQESPPGPYTHDEYLSENPGPVQPLPSGSNINFVYKTTDADVPTFSEPKEARQALASARGLEERLQQSLATPLNSEAHASTLRIELQEKLQEVQQVMAEKEALPWPQLSSSSSKLQQASDSVADWMSLPPLTATFPVQRPAVQVAGDLVASPRLLSGARTSRFHEQRPTVQVAGDLSPRPLRATTEPKDDAVREEVEDLDFMKTLRKTVASDKERERLMLEWLLTKYT